MNETLIHLLPQEYDASSLSSQRTDGINGENSTLTVLGSEQTNGTQYRCGVLEQATTIIVEYSTVATLAVQGIYDIVYIMRRHVNCGRTKMTNN